ncbi:hypothetical protein D3C87_21950 [compost metagenome]
MKVQYAINENDLLTHQLFIASKSDRIKKQRRRNRSMGLAYLPMAVIFFFTHKYPLAISFFVLGVLWFFLYPLWEKGKFIRNYQLFINENVKDRIGRVATIEINDESILVKENGNEGKIQLEELEAINEIPSIILLGLKGGQSLIIPRQEIVNTPGLIIELKELALKLNIPYKTDPDWVWK